MVSKVEQQRVDENICVHFKPPIYYIQPSKRCVLHKDLIQDLELAESVDVSGSSNMDYVIDSSSNLAKIVRTDMIKYYTTDNKFIKNTKCLLKKISLEKNNTQTNTINCDEIYEEWKDLKADKDFKDRYNYIDWENTGYFGNFEVLNKNSTFLQVLSVYNLSAPIIALLVPIMMLFIPFLVIQARGTEITFSEYFNILKEVSQRHAIVKLITSFSNVSWNERFYLLVSASIYLFSLYQNTQICLKFYKNMFTVHETLFKLCDFIELTIEKGETFLKQSRKLKSYKKFNEVLTEHLGVLEKLSKEIREIHPFCFSYEKLTDMGAVLKCFYEIHSSDEYNESISFAFGFNGYLFNMEKVKLNILQGHMKYGTLKSGTNALQVKNVYYPPLSEKSPEKNTIKINKDCIITGPNASGKTTLLKSVLINIILTQQYGCGFYDSMTFSPYDHLHCYLNIPDTSGRDSLFQSESRKCKKILDKINKLGEKVRHFCLFDELYSGTNPKEAVKCGYAYLSHLSVTPNVQYMLTTHYNEICDKFSNSSDVDVYKMLVHLKEDSSIEYTYQLKKGVNRVDGGVEVLRQLNYPHAILNKMNEID